MDLNQILQFLQDNETTMVIIASSALATGLQHKIVQFVKVSKGWVRAAITVLVSFIIPSIPVLLGLLSSTHLLSDFATSLTTMTLVYNFIVKVFGEDFKQLDEQITAIIAPTAASDVVMRPAVEYEG